MTEKTAQENQALIAFWDKAFALSDEDQKQRLEDGGPDWKEIAPSEKLFQAACSLGIKKTALSRRPGFMPSVTASRIVFMQSVLIQTGCKASLTERLTA